MRDRRMKANGRRGSGRSEGAPSAGRLSSDLLGINGEGVLVELS